LYNFFGVGVVRRTPVQDNANGVEALVFSGLERFVGIVQPVEGILVQGLIVRQTDTKAHSQLWHLRMTA
jgi:hypothetical protein